MKPKFTLGDIVSSSWTEKFKLWMTCFQSKCPGCWRLPAQQFYHWHPTKTPDRLQKGVVFPKLLHFLTILLRFSDNFYVFESLFWLKALLPLGAILLRSVPNSKNDHKNCRGRTFKFNHLWIFSI